jgi:7,8-dihydropterin-6-yl-methyl-4-(beta-D-ribofuranosyl)aminobenzene 5'-phosphate synthase
LLVGLSGTLSRADSDPVTLTVLYDNIPFDKNLQTHWGFSCLVEKGSTRVLIDTGAQAATLLANLKVLKLDVSRLDAIILSHIHDDHTKGLPGLANEVVTDPPVYVLASFPSEFKRKIRTIEVSAPMVLPDRDFRTTGELPGQMSNEQALIVTSPKGLVVVTGCAHPGIVEIVRRVREISGERIHLVMGGFHLLQTPAAEVEAIGRQLHALGVERVAPSHCTGEAAIEILKKEYGTNFLASGVGRVLYVDGGPGTD